MTKDNLRETLFNSNMLIFIQNPLDQFEIRELLSFSGPLLLNINLSLINISLYIVIASAIILNFNIINNNLNRIIPNN